MILYKQFNNASEFQQVFGLRECGNGNKSRMNKILLGCLKNREFVRYARHNASGLFLIKDMATFKEFLLNKISSSSLQQVSGYVSCLPFENRSFWFALPNMSVDNEGLCEDGDTRSVRYVNKDNGRAFKMKAGKFFTKIVENCEFGQHLPQQAKSWLGEEFLTSWQSYAARHMDKNFEFHYGNDVEDFEEIYSSEHRRGDFHSCMTDEGFHTMYVDAVKAHAAWLKDADGKMFARCVIWDEVRDETTGETLRLAERQYSDDVQACLKKQLVDELIARGLIDGYKQIGASCHDNRAYVLNDGTSLSSHKLSIECHLKSGDAVSYMDSFVYYDTDEQRAYNYHISDAIELDTTEGTFEDHENDRWSDYYDEWIPEDEACYVEERNDYFYDCDCVLDWHGNYQFEDDCVQCDQTGNWVLKDEAFQIGGGEFYDLYFQDEEAAEEWLDEKGWVWCDYEDVYDRDPHEVKVWSSGMRTWVEYTMAGYDYEEYKDNIEKLHSEDYLCDTEAARLAFESECDLCNQPIHAA